MLLNEFLIKTGTNGVEKASKTQHFLKIRSLLNYSLFKRKIALKKVFWNDKLKKNEMLHLFLCPMDFINIFSRLNDKQNDRNNLRDIGMVWQWNIDKVYSNIKPHFPLIL